MYAIREGKQDEYTQYVNKNTDDYSAAIVRYSRQWAELMEQRMAQGAVLDKWLYSVTSNEADTEGITGFMFGAAVAELSQFWQHGHVLRRIHNGNYGVGDDTAGVVNPAVIWVRPK